MTENHFSPSRPTHKHTNTGTSTTSTVNAEQMLRYVYRYSVYSTHTQCVSKQSGGDSALLFHCQGRPREPETISIYIIYLKLFSLPSFYPVNPSIPWCFFMKPLSWKAGHDKHRNSSFIKERGSKCFEVSDRFTRSCVRAQTHTHTHTCKGYGNA